MLVINFFCCLHSVSETEELARNCLRLVSAHQSLRSDQGVDSLPTIASRLEQCCEELKNAISSTTDR